MARTLETYEGGTDIPNLLSTTPIPDSPKNSTSELEAAITEAIKDEAVDSPVRKLAEALLGQAGREGKIAGTPL